MEGISGGADTPPAKEQSSRQTGILLRHFYFTHFLLKCQARSPNQSGSFSFTYLLYMRERFSAVGASCARDIARNPKHL